MRFRIQPASSRPWRSFRSAPTQNAFSPAAARTTTQAFGLAAAWRRAPARVSATSPEMAFMASGRLRVTTAT
jgi:hypothetical protein